MMEQVITVLVTTAVTSCITYIAARYKVEKALQHGVQALLRDRMLQSYEVYQGQLGCTVEQKQNFSNMYTCYHALGQNGVMTEIHKTVLHMPVK